MKTKVLLHFAGVLLMSQLLSCSSKEYFSFSPAPPAYTKAKPEPAKILETDNPVATESLATSPEKPAITETEPVLEANAGTPVPVLLEKKTTTPVKVNVVPVVEPATENKPAAFNEAQALKTAKERLASMTKAEKKELKKEIRKSIQGSAASSTNILLIILAILIPPLAVGLYEGITNRFWISLLLTILFFLPGMIYALLVVTDTI